MSSIASKVRMCEYQNNNDCGDAWKKFDHNGVIDRDEDECLRCETRTRWERGHAE